MQSTFSAMSAGQDSLLLEEEEEGGEVPTQINGSDDGGSTQKGK